VDHSGGQLATSQRQEELDQLRVELAPAERADLVQRVLDRPCALIGALGDERVEDVAVAVMRPASGMSSPARPTG
jgi:hypothetical protein